MWDDVLKKVQGRRRTHTHRAQQNELEIVGNYI